MIRAIETQYKGYRFRSRLEARWAVFFDAMGIKWEYEKEGFDLGAQGYYLPDFWLPDFFTPNIWGIEGLESTGAFFEVKPTKPSGLEIAKGNAIWSMVKRPLFFLVDAPDNTVPLWFPSEKETKGMFGKCIGCGTYQLATSKGCRCCGRSGPLALGFHFGDARMVARSARFEHGESPDLPRRWG